MPGGVQVTLSNDYGYRLLCVEQRTLQCKFNDTLLVQHRVYRAGHGRFKRAVQRVSPRDLQGVERHGQLHGLPAQLEFVGR
jgi:hypothetical protein